MYMCFLWIYIAWKCRFTQRRRLVDFMQYSLCISVLGPVILHFYDLYVDWNFVWPCIWIIFFYLYVGRLHWLSGRSWWFMWGWWPILAFIFSFFHRLFYMYVFEIFHSCEGVGMRQNWCKHNGYMIMRTINNYD